MVQIPTLQESQPIAPKEDKDLIQPILNQTAKLLNQIEKIEIDSASNDIINIMTKAQNFNIENLDKFRIENGGSKSLAQNWRQIQNSFNQDLLKTVPTVVANRLQKELYKLQEDTFQNNLEFTVKKKMQDEKFKVLNNFDSLNQLAYTSKGSLNFDYIIDMANKSIEDGKKYVYLDQNQEKQVRSDVVKAYLSGAALTNPEGAIRLLDSEILKNYVTGEDYINLNRQVTDIAKTTLRKRQAEAQNQLNNLKNDVLEGKQISATSLNNIDIDIIKSYDSELAKDLYSFHNYIDTLNSLNQTSTSNMREIASEIKDDNLKNLIYEKIAYQEAAFKKDGLIAALKQGVTSSPITDFNNLEQLQRRDNDVSVINKTFDVNSTIFYPEERQYLTNAFANSSPQVQLSMGITLAQGFNRENLGRALNELNISPTMIQNIYYANSDLPNAINIQSNIISGRKVIEDFKPKNLSLNQIKMAEKIGNGLPIDQLKIGIDRAMGAFYYKLLQSGELSNSEANESNQYWNSVLNFFGFDEDNTLFEEAITEALGSYPIDYKPKSGNNMQKILPPIGTSGNDFLNVIDKLNSKDLALFGSNTNLVTEDDVRKQIKNLPQYYTKIGNQSKYAYVDADFFREKVYLENIAPNTYRLLVKDGYNSQYLVNNDKTVFILYLDANRINQIKAR